MKSPESWSKSTESGHSAELLDLAEQIEKGMKWGRIPAVEAIGNLRKLKDAYLPNVESLSQSSGDEEEILLGLMEVIENAVKSGAIPANEAVSIFDELNNKYPIKEG